MVNKQSIINQLADTPSPFKIKNQQMTGLEIINDLLVGVSGNAAYDQLKAVVKAYQPSLPAERETFEKLENLLDMGVRNIQTQTEILSQLHAIKTEMVAKQNPTIQNHQTINNYGAVGKQVTNPTIHGDFHM